MSNSVEFSMVDQVSQSGGAAVLGALKNASQKTGVGFDFLYKMAQRESALDPSAKAPTSSAAGLFQFIEQTWLGAVKNYGAGHGLGAEAVDITRGVDGRLTVADKARRDEILNLRFDAQKASALAAELTNENKAGLEKRLGRAVGAGDLYAAHFLGVAGAVKLLSASPDAKAADLLPAAAKANRPVFFDGGVPKSVSAVIASIEKSMGAAVERAAVVVEELKTQSPLSFVNKATRPGTVAAITANTSVPRETSVDGLLQKFSGKLGGGLSPLALVVLQALDPTSLRNKD